MADQALVVDVGSSSVKAGFSGEDWPRTLLPSVIDGAPKVCSTFLSHSLHHNLYSPA